MKTRHLIPVLLALVLAVGIYAFSRSDQNQPLPPPQDHNSFTPPAGDLAPDPTPQPSPSPSPAEVNLNVPFTSQAPHQNWSEPYQNFCEEASALMAASYVLNQTIANADDADQKLLAIKAYEDRTFGYYMDTTAAETAKILTDYYGIQQVKLLDNPTVDDVKQAVAAGKVVLAPASGKDLPNPHFTNGGPVYHMLLVKGYTKDGKFITNDPGTRLGANFLYKYSDLMDAIHDWSGFDHDIHEGKRVVIVVG
jgi:hypothetical protein